jgi:hypothetical protein
MERATGPSGAQIGWIAKMLQRAFNWLNWQPSSPGKFIGAL